jgi:hypothetical protein
MIDKNVPGPGKYSYLRPFGSDGVKHSLSPKAKDSCILNLKNKIPGPGAYNTTTSPNEKSQISNLKNLVNVKWSLSKERRFDPLSTLV